MSKKNKIVNLGMSLLKALFAPKEELKQTEGLAEKNLRAHLEHSGISDFLMYRYYEQVNDEMGIYHMADGRKGFIVRVFPTSTNPSSVEDAVFSLVDSIKEPGSIIHANTFSSRNIHFKIEKYKKTHTCDVNVDNVETLKELVDDTYEGLKKGVNESIVKGLDFRVKDFVSTISILFPKDTEMNKIEASFYELLGNLNDLFPTNFEASQLLSLTKEMLQPDKNMEDWNRIHDRHRVLNNQIASGTKIKKSKSDNGDYNVGDWTYRTLTTKHFPNEDKIITNFDLYNLLFDRFGDNMQIPLPCPFFVSLVVIINDKDKSKDKARKKSIDDMNKVKKLKKDVRDEDPDLGGRLNEAKRNIKLVQHGGQAPMDAMWSLTLMEKDEKKLSQYTKVIKERFANKDWHIEEEKFTNIGLFVFLYSLPLQHHKIVQKFVKRFDILFTSNTAAIAPIVGNIPSIDIVVPVLDRNGQLIGYSNFSGISYNEFKTGASGAGKSYSQAFTHIHKLAANIKIRTIDNGHSYRRLCKMIGGTYIDVGGNPNISLNFFTNALTAKVVDEDGNDTTEDLLVKNSSGQLVKMLHREAISSIAPIVGLMAGLDFIIDGKDLTPRDGTEQSYLSAVITKAVVDTFIQYQHEGRLEYTRELIKKRYEYEKQLGNNDQASLLYNVYVGLSEFADPAGSEYNRFNLPNKLDFNKDYVVMDTSGLKGRILNIVTLSLAMNVKAEFWREGINRYKNLDIDEGWMFKDNPIVVKLIEDNARTFRKSKSGQGFITQSIEDANSNDSMRALFSNSLHKFLLSQSPKEIEKVSRSDFFPMGPFEKKLYTSIKNKKPYWGEALYENPKTGSTAMVIKASPKVNWVCAAADPEGNTLFENTKERYELNDIETVRFLAKKGEDPNISENELYNYAKNYCKVENVDESEKREFWRNELKQAISKKSFNIRLEPIKTVEEKATYSYETFLELKHDDGTTSFYPQYFKYLKEFGHEETVFKIMLDKLFRYAENRNEQFHINLMTEDIRNNKLMGIIEKYLGMFDVSGKIVLELKETDSNNNIEELENFIKRFHYLNVKIALDNISVHYHKTTYLILLKADYVKIEGDLIFEAQSNEGLRTVLESFVTMSKQGLQKEKKIIVTKIENEQDIEFIKNNKIDCFQGRINRKEIRYI